MSIGDPTLEQKNSTGTISDATRYFTVETARGYLVINREYERSYLCVLIISLFRVRLHPASKIKSKPLDCWHSSRKSTRGQQLSSLNLSTKNQHIVFDYHALIVSSRTLSADHRVLTFHVEHNPSEVDAKQVVSSACKSGDREWAGEQRHEDDARRCVSIFFVLSLMKSDSRLKRRSTRSSFDSRHLVTFAHV